MYNVQDMLRPSFQTVYTPGNGTRYALTWALREGGGWFIAWPDYGALFIVRPGAWPSGPVELESRGREVSDVDREALTEHATTLYGVAQDAVRR